MSESAFPTSNSLHDYFMKFAREVSCLLSYSITVIYIINLRISNYARLLLLLLLKMLPAVVPGRLAFTALLLLLGKHCIVLWGKVFSTNNLIYTIRARNHLFYSGRNVKNFQQINGTQSRKRTWETIYR